MFNKFCQDSEIVNFLKAKKGIAPILVKGICPILSAACGELVFSIGVYYGENYDDKASEILSLWLDLNKDLLSQAEDLVRLTRKGKKQSKVAIAIKSFVN